MNEIANILKWFTGGEHQYMRLYGCMQRDALWITITIALDVFVAVGYSIIACHWWKNQRSLPDVPAKRALADIRNIFILCGLCGYVFIPIKMFWPAWRLYDMALVVLVYFTWRYALTTSNFKVVYSELGRSARLAADLEQSYQDALRRSQFLNAVSHDLRTPLNGLALQTGVAEMSLKKQNYAAVSQALTDIKASTRATADLLDSLLECVRADWSEQENKPTQFSLNDLLQEIQSRLIGVASGKSVTLSYVVAADVTLQTDRKKLDRVLSNLVANAVKFTDEGSVRVKVDRAAAGVEIHVIDTGVGIAPELHERLFDEFFQVENRERDPRKGFGLGLAIARRLARQLGGDIAVESAPGRGSRFTVQLPSKIDSAEASTIRPATYPLGGHDRVGEPAPTIIAGNAAAGVVIGRTIA